MKRKIMGVLCILVLVAGIGAIYLCCRRPVRSISAEGIRADFGQEELGESTWQLISNAESQEEAEEIAQMYQVTLLEYKDGVALYETKEDPTKVIQRGEEQGYPQMWINVERKAY